jgi:hypothetical protein
MNALILALAIIGQELPRAPEASVIRGTGGPALAPAPKSEPTPTPSPQCCVSIPAQPVVVYQCYGLAPATCGGGGWYRVRPLHRFRLFRGWCR